MSPRDLFPGLEPTRAPAGLRDRVLDTAIRVAAELPSEVRDLLPPSRRARAASPTASDRRLLEQVLASSAWNLS